VTQDELNVLVAELRMDATDGEYPTRDQRAERAADEIERLSAEVTRLRADRDRHEAAALEQAERFRRAEAEITSLTDELFEQAGLRERAEGERDEAKRLLTEVTADLCRHSAHATGWWNDAGMRGLVDRVAEMTGRNFDGC
jgi:chromosome segregation ATPase